MRPDAQMTMNKYFSLPDNLQQEVEDFIDFLETKYQGEVRNRLHPKKKRTSHFGSARGLIIMKDDFDKPIEDFRDYM